MYYEYTTVTGIHFYIFAPLKGRRYNSPVNVVVLCFDLLTRSKMPFKVMHRKEVIHSNGSYERKSRGRKLADERGRAKKKSHGTLQSDAPEESDL